MPDAQYGDTAEVTLVSQTPHGDLTIFENSYTTYNKHILQES